MKKTAMGVLPHMGILLHSTLAVFLIHFVNQFFYLIFFLILYRDPCVGDTSIDLTPLQSIVYRYRLTLSSSIMYRLTQKLGIAPISVHTLYPLLVGLFV